MNPYDTLKRIWNELYGSSESGLFDAFITELKGISVPDADHGSPDWYKDVVVYSIYVDLFNKDFKGLEAKLDYLADLGVSCLWLLPVLKSPMRDAGFDISDYRTIRPDLLGEAGDAGVFEEFVKKAHRRRIRVIFDIAINHTSEEHWWFQESKSSRDNPYRDFYIWSDNPDQYPDARIIFKGIETSNWRQESDAWFFHRFFDFQPDLNYRNPKVLIEMSRNFLFWLKVGVDGFRADAIPYLWKEEGTTCENLPKTHTVVKFFRAVLDAVKPGTLLLAEACQKPVEVVNYFGNGDECHAGYHFPLMPQIFKSIASQSAEPVKHILSTDVTPVIPSSAQWFTFLRCHDELSLELVYVSEEDRKYIHENYCKQQVWDFREGQGISARLAELMDRDPRKIGLAFSIMLTLPGTPVIYYGDEFGKLNDEDYYREMIALAGKDDTRFLVRGRIDWATLQNELERPESYETRVYSMIRNFIHVRNTYTAFGRGEIRWHTATDPDDNPLASVLMFERTYNSEHLLLIHNLSENSTKIKSPIHQIIKSSIDLLGNPINPGDTPGSLLLGPYSCHWIKFD